MKTKELIEKSEEKPPDPNTVVESLRTGFITGIQKDGSFGFQLVGENRSMSDVFAVQEFCRRTIDRIYDGTVRDKDKTAQILAEQLNPVLIYIYKKLDHITNLIDKPIEEKNEPEV